MSKLYTTYKFGKPTSTSWSGIFGYKPPTPTAAAELGEMFAVLALASEAEFEFEHIGSFLFDELQTTYFETEKASIDQFEKALDAVRTKVEQILGQEKELADAGIDMQLAVVVLQQEVMYAGVVGESHVFVQRDGETNEISAVLSDPDLDGFMRIGSLRLLEGDRVMVATDNVDSSNSQDKIAAQMMELSTHELDVARGAALLIGNNVEPGAIEVDPEPEVTPELTAVAETSAIVNEPEPVLDNSEVLETAEQPEVETPANRVKLPFLTHHESPSEAQLDVTPTEVPDDLDALSQAEDEIDLRSVSRAGSQHSSEGAVGKLRETASKAGAGLSKLFNTAKEKIGTGTQSVRQQQKWKDLTSRATVAARGLQDNISSRAGGRPGDRAANIGRYRGRGGAMRTGNERTRYMVAAAAILAIVVIVGIRQTVVENDRRSQVAALQQQADRLATDIEQLQANAAAASVSFQPEPKVQVLADARDIEAKLKQINDNQLTTPTLQSQVDQLTDEVEEARDIALKVKGFIEPQVVTNLAANFPGTTPADIVLIENNLYVADSALNKVYRMGTGIGSQAASVLNDLTQPYQLTVDTQKNLIVVDRNSQSSVGVMAISNNAFRRIPGLGFDRLGEISGAFVWTNRSLYTINQQQKAIIRMGAVGTNYQAPNYSNPWRRDELFSGARDLHVDGAIYTLIPGQGVSRFLGGNPDPIQLRGLMPEDEQAARNAVAFEMTAKNLYLADPANRRVLVFTKDATDGKLFDFVAQHVYRGSDEVMTDIKDMVATANDTQLFVLTGTQIVRMDVQ